MRCAIYVPNYGSSFGDPSVLCSLAVEAEAAGSGDVVERRGALFEASGVRFAPVEVPIWVGGIWPREVPFRAASRAAGVVPATFGAEGFGGALPC